MTRTLTIAAALAAVLSPAAAAAQAGWQIGPDSIRLYNRDLDLNSAAGRATLLARVAAAAGRLCRDSADPRGCRATTVAATMRARGIGRDGAAQVAAR